MIVGFGTTFLGPEGGSIPVLFTFIPDPLFLFKTFLIINETSARDNSFGFTWQMERPCDVVTGASRVTGSEKCLIA